jgi:prepilin-type N-terminal cleavage/methylation domain-containing protein
MRWIKGHKGVTLIELMITLAIFSIIMGMIYSVYNTFLKHATTERKVAKTELDVFNISWPLMKEIQLAGYGVPSTTGVDVCPTALWTTVMNGKTALGIYSTAAGDAQNAGKWAHVVSDTCRVTTTDIWTAPRNVVVLSNLDNKRRLGRTTLTYDGGSAFLSNCASSYEDNIAYWIPYDAEDTNPLECYNTIYSWGTTDTAPAMCATDTGVLRRSVTSTTSTNHDPILDCVLDLDFRFGCINASGNLTWQTSSTCSNSILRLVKVGMVVQNSQRLDYQWGTSLTLFGDLRGLSKPVNLTGNLGYYKWRRLENVITLRNTR